MADEKHLEILKSGVWKWNKWREENKDIIPNLIGADLSSADLRGAILYDANLSSANLADTNLSDTELSFANLMKATLTGINLSFAGLVGANLNSANMHGANLTAAELLGANLCGANLTKSKLAGTILTKVDLSGADLTGANLFRADLSKANLSEADLSEADLSEARINRTVFGLTDLGTCIGLETVEVAGPCIIDFQTLRASKNIPKSFLLKIGLPELYITYLPDFYHDQGFRIYPVFLSHSWENKDFARKLYEALIDKGVNVFFDEKKLKPGDPVFDSLSRGIELYDKTILVCSKDSLNSWWVDQELELLLEKERKIQEKTGKKIGLLIPITIDNDIHTWSGAKRMVIKSRTIGDFSAWQDDAAFEKALDNLIHGLHVDRLEIDPLSYLLEK